MRPIDVDVDASLVVDFQHLQAGASHGDSPRTCARSHAHALLTADGGPERRPKGARTRARGTHCNCSVYLPQANLRDDVVVPD